MNSLVPFVEPEIKMMQLARRDNPFRWDSWVENVEESLVPEILREGDHSTDIIFTVEEQNLHFCKALLTMCSPVFHNLLTPEYIQQHSEGIPLPGKKYGAVAFFLQQLHPAYSAVTPVTDDILLDVLALAEEYQVEHIKTKCEQYIGSQLQFQRYGKRMTTDMLLIYLTACEEHILFTHRENLVELAAKVTTQDLLASKFFLSVPATVLKDVFLVRCRKLEMGTEQFKNEASSLKNTIQKRLQTVKSHIDSTLSYRTPGFSRRQENLLNSALEEIQRCLSDVNPYMWVNIRY